MSYDIETITDNCYDGTTCLINKFNIRDEEQLSSVESQITAAKISMLQQIREGNGRTQRVFLSQLAFEAGYEIDFASADMDELMIATIQSSNGVDTYLHDVLDEITSPISL